MYVQQPTEDQQLAVQSFRKFLESEIRPIAARYRDHHLPKDRMRELTQAVAEFGLPGASVAAEHGGMGLPLVTEAMLFEELCTVSLDIGLAVMTNKSMAATLAELPDSQAHLRDRYLPDVLAGRGFGGFCINETAASAVAGLASIRDGDKELSNGDYADIVVVTLRTGQGDLSHLLVDRADPDQGSHAIETIALEKARADVGMLAVGLMRAALEASIAHAREHQQFGKPIAAHQLVAARIAEMATLLDASRLMCFRAFSMMDQGIRCDMQSSMAKWFATENAVKVCRAAVQLHGGNGFGTEFDAERLAREAIVIPIPDGSTEIQKLAISRALTGIAAFV